MQNPCPRLPFVLVYPFLLGSIFLSGCSRNVHVTGRVTFPDGTPLTVGAIYFTDDFTLGRSDIDKNGEYSLHTFRKNDGIPKGLYKVYITGAVYLVPGSSRDQNGERLSSEDFSLGDIQFAIDRQHTIPDTSGWLFDIQKNTVINLTVYPPIQVPEEARTEEAKYFFDAEYRKKVKRERGEPPPKKPKMVNPKLL